MLVSEFRLDDIPPEKAATVRKLDAMRQDGWTALESMSLADLDALEAEAESARVVRPVEHPHLMSIADALTAIKRRRSAIRRAAVAKATEQQERYKSIFAAQLRITEAARALDAAQAIEFDPNATVNAIPAPFPAIDVSTASEGELRATIKACEAALTRKLPADSKSIALLKTSAAKSIADELKAREKALFAMQESARANMDAAKMELERRHNKAVENARRKAELEANLPSIVDDLQQRVAKLEAD